MSASRRCLTHSRFYPPYVSSKGGIARLVQVGYYGALPGDVHTFLVEHLLAVAAMSRVAELIPRRRTCSDFRDSSLLLVVVALEVGNTVGHGMDAVAHMGHMMENELTVLLRCCRHARAASQYSRAPQPRARMLGRCSVDELRHAATDRVRLARYRHDRWPVLPTCRSCDRCVHGSSAGPQNSTVDLCVRLWSAVMVTI